MITIKPFPTKPVMMFITKAEPCKGGQDRVNLPSPSGAGKISIANQEKRIDNIAAEFKKELGVKGAKGNVYKLEGKLEKFLTKKFGYDKSKDMINIIEDQWSDWSANSSEIGSRNLKKMTDLKYGTTTTYHKKYFDHNKKLRKTFDKAKISVGGKKDFSLFDEAYDYREGFTRYVNNIKHGKVVKLYRGVTYDSLIKNNIITKSELKILAGESGTSANVRTIKNKINKTLEGKNLDVNSLSSWTSSKSVSKDFATGSGSLGTKLEDEFGYIIESDIETKNILSDFNTNSGLPNTEFEYVVKQSKIKIKKITFVDF